MWNDDFDGHGDGGTAEDFVWPVVIAFAFLWFAFVVLC